MRCNHLINPTFGQLLDLTTAEAVCASLAVRRSERVTKADLHRLAGHVTITSDSNGPRGIRDLN